MSRVTMALPAPEEPGAYGNREVWTFWKMGTLDGTKVCQTLCGVHALQIKTGHLGFIMLRHAH